MSLESKAKTSSQIEEVAKKTYWELVWGKRDEKGDYHALTKVEYDEKSAFYHSQLWVPFEEAQKAIKDARLEVDLINRDNIFWWKNKFQDLREKVEFYYVWLNFMINNPPHFPGQRDTFGMALDKYHTLFGDSPVTAVESNKGENKSE
jgi:hypothetical protein